MWWGAERAESLARGPPAVRTRQEAPAKFRNPPTKVIGHHDDDSARGRWSSSLIAGELAEEAAGGKV